MGAAKDTIWCPRCQRRYRVPANAGGKTLRCKSCEYAFLISDALTVDPHLAKQSLDDAISPSEKPSPKKSNPAKKPRFKGNAKKKDVAPVLMDNDFDDVLSALDNPNSSRSTPAANRKAHVEVEDVGPAPQRAHSKRGRSSQPAAKTNPRETRAEGRTASDETSPGRVTEDDYNRNQSAKKLWVRVAMLLALIGGLASAYTMYSRPASMLSEREFAILNWLNVPPTWIAGSTSAQVVKDANDAEVADNGLASIRLRNEFEHLARKPKREVATNRQDGRMAPKPFGAGDANGEVAANDGAMNGNNGAANGNQGPAVNPGNNQFANRQPGANGQMGMRDRRAMGGPPTVDVDMNGRMDPTARVDAQRGNRNVPGQAARERDEARNRRMAGNGGNRANNPNSNPGANDANNGQRAQASDRDMQIAMSRGVDPKIVGQIKPPAKRTRLIAFNDEIAFLSETASSIAALDWKTKEVLAQAKLEANVSAISTSQPSNGQQIAWVATADGTVERWSLAQGRFEKSGEFVTAMKSVDQMSSLETASGSILAVADGSAVKWLLKSADQESEFSTLNENVFENHVLAIRISSDGKQLLVSDGLKWIVVEVETGRIVSEQKFAAANLRTAAFSPDGSLVAGSDGKKVSLFKTNDGTLVRDQVLPFADDISFSSDTSLLCLKQGLVEQLAVPSLRVMDRYWPTGSGQLVAMAATNKYLFGLDRSVGELGYVFELAKNVSPTNDVRGGGRNANVAIDRRGNPNDGGRRVGAGGPNRQQGRKVVAIPLVKNVPSLVAQSPSIAPGISKITFDMNNRLLLSTNDHAFFIADWENSKWLESEFKSQVEEQVSSLAVSLDGNSLVVGSASGRVDVWDLTGAKPTFKFRFDGHAKSVTEIEFTSNSELVVSGDSAGRVICWNLKDGEQQNVFDEFKGAIRSLSVGGDGKLVTATDGLQTVRGRAGSGSGKYVALRQEYTRSWISPGGSKLAILRAGQLQVFDRSSLKLIETVKPDGVIVDLIFSSDGKYVFVRDNRFVSQWNWKSGRRVAQYDAANMKFIVDFSLSQDDQHLAIIEGNSGSTDVRVFKTKE